MFKLVSTNECRVEVEVRKPWLIELSPDHAYRNANNIIDQINRHVDDVDSVHIDQKHVWRDNDGLEYDNLYDALEYWFDEEGIDNKFQIRYERPSDNGFGVTSRKLSFEEMIEEAWMNPWKFELLSGPQLNEAQQKFLDNVLKASLEQNAVKEE